LIERPKLLIDDENMSLWWTRIIVDVSIVVGQIMNVNNKN
jgi:hypothetical protein